MIPRPPTSTLFPYTTLFRSFTGSGEPERVAALGVTANFFSVLGVAPAHGRNFLPEEEQSGRNHVAILRSEEHTSELQSLAYLVCRLLLEKKKKNISDVHNRT